MKTLTYFNIRMFTTQCCQKNMRDKLREKVYRNIGDNVLSTIAIRINIFDVLRKDLLENEK
jgi:hypothetical protein